LTTDEEEKPKYYPFQFHVYKTDKSGRIIEYEQSTMAEGPGAWHKVLYTYNSTGQISEYRIIDENAQLTKTITYNFDAFGKVVSAKVDDVDRDENRKTSFYVYVYK
jgi:hypothetical protein